MGHARYWRAASYLIDSITGCCPLNSIKTWLYNWHNLKCPGATCTLRCNCYFLAATCSFLLTLFRGAMYNPVVEREFARKNHPFESKTISLASYSGKHRKNTAWKWIFTTLDLGWTQVKSWIHASSFFLVGSNLTDLASRGWTKVLICVAMYCKDSGFQACGAPGQDWWHTFGVRFCCGRSWSFRVRISLVSSIFEDWFGLQKKSKNRGFGPLKSHFWIFLGHILGQLSKGLGDTWAKQHTVPEHQVLTHLDLLMADINANLNMEAQLAMSLEMFWMRKHPVCNPAFCLQVFFCRYLATDYNRKNQITTSSFRIAHIAACHVRSTSKFQLSPEITWKCWQERDEHFYQIAALQCFGCELRYSCFI